MKREVAQGPTRADYVWFGIRFGVAMALVAIALFLIVGIITAPLGLALLAFIGWWLGETWLRIKRKQWSVEDGTAESGKGA